MARIETPGTHPYLSQIRLLVQAALLILGLLADTAILKQLFTPVMGLAILHGIALFTRALGKPPVTTGTS